MPLCRVNRCKHLIYAFESRYRRPISANELNCWRDVFPGSPIEQLIKKSTKPSLTLDIQPGEIVPAYDPDKIVFIPWSGIDQKHVTQGFKRGRFYPQGMLAGLPGIFKENQKPFRCIEIESKGIRADLNHPMAIYPLTLSLSVQPKSQKTEERGGSCQDWIDSRAREYLIDPVRIFKEVARILKPRGYFIITFSNRWFPEKVTRIWEDLHDFERMGLVTEYFFRSHAYDSISTVSMRGYPRPYEDKYFRTIRLSDPIYAVAGKTMK